MKLLHSKTSMNTFFLIKPDGMRHEQRILAKIRERFGIENYVTLIAEDKFIHAIYEPTVPPDILPAVNEYLREGSIGCGFAQASIDTFIELTGKNMIPSECPPGTIRKEYGSGAGITASGLTIIRNAIHRPKNQQQNIFLAQHLKHYYGINPYKV